MRPLPLRPVAGAPRWVSGLAIIRGEPLPVIDLADVLGAETGTPERYVTLRSGERRIAVAVDAVEGVRAIAGDALRVTPPLLTGAAGDVVAQVGTLDAELLLVLRSARLFPAGAIVAADAPPAPEVPA